MRVILSIALALAVLHICGFGLSGFLTRRFSIPRKVLVLPLGYAASQLIYFAWLMLTWQTRNAAWAAVIIPGGVSLAWAWASRRAATSPAEGPQPKESCEHWILWAGLLLIALVAAWPHVYCGWGNYWHSGNPDILDALYARDILIKYGAHVHAAPGGAGWLGPQELQSAQRSIREFFEMPIHLQYTSMAFWAYLLNSFEGMDIFLAQAVVNLLLMAHGVYFLGRRSLRLHALPAMAAAVGSVLGNFYFTTFVNGHEGSMMFMAVLPHVLLLALEKSPGGAAALHRYAALFLLCAFLGIAYPFPLGYFLIPYLLHAASSRLLARYGGADAAWQRFRSLAQARKAVLVSAAAAVGFGSLAYVWHTTAYLRFRSLVTFRSWRMMDTIFRDTLFWGLWPSPVAFGESGHANIVNLLRTHPALGWPITVFSLACAWALYALVAFWTWKKREALPGFFLVFVLLWPFLLTSMLVVVGDPYFVYKFMYTTQFLLILILAYGFQNSMPTSAAGNTFKILCALLLTLTALANIVHDVYTSHSLLARQYNINYSTYIQLHEIPKETLSRTSLQIPLFDSDSIIRYFLYNQGIETSSMHNAEYVLTMKGFHDVLTLGMDKWNLIWQNSLFRLRRFERENTLQLYSNLFPEFSSMGDDASIPFRWVTDQKGFNLPGGFKVTFSNLTKDTRYLRFCIASGPSYDYRPFDLPVSEDGQDSPLLTLHANAQTCFWIALSDLEGHQQPFHFKPERRGKSLLPYDERKLDFKLAQLGLTSERYDRQGLLFLTDPRDIVPPEHSQALHAGQALPAPAVLLGNGWYPSEQQGPGVFRWAEKDAEVLVLNSGGRPCRFTLEVESGPNLVGRGALLSALGERGEALWSGSLGGRTKVQFSVPPSEAKVMPIRLTPSKIPAALPDDPRALAFRVFSISIEPEPGPKPRPPGPVEEP